MLRWWPVAGLSCLVVAMSLVGPAVAARPAPAVPGAEPVVLTVTGTDGAVKTYTLPQLKQDLPVFTGYAGTVKSGFIGMEAPRPVKGVRLCDLLDEVGCDAASTVTITASDGYSQELTMPAVQGQGIPVYQALPPTYPEVQMPGSDPLVAVVSYQSKSAGAAIDDSSPWEDYSTPETSDKPEGPLRLWYAYRDWADPGYLTPSSLSVRMVGGVTVTRPAPSEWSVPLRGPRKTLTITRTRFEAWVDSASYGETTLRVGGHTYSGLRLRTLVGMVDGGKATAFDARLARRGYGIRFLGASGSVTLSSKRLVDDPRAIVLAWERDGAELTGKAAPLWLAGGSLTSAQRLPGIRSISLRGVPK